MRGGLNHEYTERLRAAYVGSVPASADLVCYRLAKAGERVARREVVCAGLVEVGEATAQSLANHFGA